jgi:predicted nuclease of predicted toxin-antitoxin system
MKLLLDQNLSPRLKEPLADLFPGSMHVKDVGLVLATDDAVWDYAAQQGFTIVSKDSDFRQLSFNYGHPPKVIWIRLGNCSTAEIEAILPTLHDDILSFVRDEQGSFLALS